MIRASGLRPYQKGTLRAFLDLSLSPSGIVLCGCTLHEKNGKRWVGLPGRPQTNSDGSPRIDLKTGKQAWATVVEIVGTAERERFQRAALAAVDQLLGRGSAR